MDGSWRTLQMLGGLQYSSIVDDFKATTGPNYRVVLDFGEEMLEHVVDTGVNENAFSKHYSDQLELTSEGKYIEFRWNRTEADSRRDPKITEIVRKKGVVEGEL